MESQLLYGIFFIVERTTNDCGCHLEYYTTEIGSELHFFIEIGNVAAKCAVRYLITKRHHKEKTFDTTDTVEIKFII